ncbi:methyltransferase domain-containing protein [Streptomyces sp. NPDC058308]|uniref:methyltransferase domain-containing protein n=1 Tax=Streptomyces sp. NPDC058308 TaxID=3346440 RepID=UPI0036E26267
MSQENSGTMAQQADPIDPKQVGAWYDQFGDVYHQTIGDSLHCGLWVPPDAPPPAGLDLVTLSSEAQDRYTDYLISVLHLRPGQRFLDIGCGPGRPAGRLAELTGAHVTGISVSKEQIDRAVRLAAETAGAAGSGRLTFEVADATCLPYDDESFDGAWAVESIGHMDRAKALKEAWRVLRPGGELLVLEAVLTAEPTEADTALYDQVLASNLPLRMPEFFALVEEAGFHTLELKDLTANLALSMDVMELVFRDRSQEMSERFGPEFAGLMAAALPGVRALVREKIRFFLLLLRK